MNEYEQAVQRIGLATVANKAALAAYSAAATELSDAIEALAQYEEKPGIPLPRYRAGA
jgi:hypothetical protein